MFNVDNIYDILNANFLRPNSLSGSFLHKFGKCDNLKDICTMNTDIIDTNQVLFTLQNVFFYDQEPVYDHNTVVKMHDFFIEEFNNDYIGMDGGIFATSELHNPKVDALCKKLKLSKWYYFYHAFASLDWFRSIEYAPKINNIWEGASYINLNNLYKGPRIYRLVFLSQLYKQGLLGDGIVSYNIDEWSEELDNMHLNSKTRQDIISFCSQVKTSHRVQTSLYSKDNSSAEPEYSLWTSAFWHVVSETCFYEKTVHLTEKIFKPIVARQPFLILSTPGALKYLKSYGFKTFDNVIDESYDEEYDPNVRILKVVDQLNKICKLSEKEKKEMYEEILSTLDHNFDHFYNNLEKIAWKELVDNFHSALAESNQLTKFHSYHKNLQYEKFSDIPNNQRCVFANSVYSSPGTLGRKLRKILK